jgi:hypothetical protein
MKNVIKLDVGYSVYMDGNTLNEVIEDGGSAIGLFAPINGVNTGINSGTYRGYANLMYTQNGKVYSLPVHSNNFKVVEAKVAGATKFVASFTVENVIEFSDHSLTFVKKGTGFNERANWVASVHVHSGKDEAYVAEQIAKYVNDNKGNLGLTATVSGAKITNKSLYL